MRISKSTRALLLAACVGLIAARSSEIKEYANEELAPGQGLVVMRVLREQAQGSNNLSVSREYKGLTALIDSTDGKQRFIVGDIDTIKAFALPAGRYYLAELRTQKERDLPKISDRKNYATRSFEVLATTVNYAGVYHVSFPLNSDGEREVAANIEFPPETVAEAAQAFPVVFKAWPLMYCQIARKCKPPSEIN
jgi:hypothetical protein